ncbi:acyl-CoA dehydrogenase [Streptomyces dioscori]|uniref:Acyl-CoA dehydrogenase n=1 Tax=Streptomyces dioscori TaxID=2109333 RepID=A0A2P8Q9L3_9ACTN|nr:acyl-CoA dehydrogenase family protein [Streptomyces dioscori]PSM42925.1 acyl-CoA dehydrogenase [Streptomyces dioscori]
MKNASPPHAPELLDRAAALVPVLRRSAVEAEQSRRLPDHLLQELAGSGLLRMRMPSRYQGQESDLRTVVSVMAELARGDGSTAWVATNYVLCSWLVSLFPDSVQDEIFADPEVRVSGVLSPGGPAAPVDGGFRVSGRWGFTTGALHSQWTQLVAVAPAPQGGAEPLMLLVPTRDLRIVDDWDTMGLRGTGSVTVEAEDVLVPSSRVLPMGPMLQEQYAGNTGNPVYRTPALLTGAVSMTGTVLGIVRAARELFFERLPTRGITYTAYDRQAEAPVTHLQVAQASLRIDEAQWHAYRAADLMDSRAAEGGTWNLEERLRMRADIGRTFELAAEAMDILNSASGASSLYSDIPMQRYWRDVHALGRHALLSHTTAYELYGRGLCGLEPNTPLI